MVGLTQNGELMDVAYKPALARGEGRASVVYEGGGNKSERRRRLGLRVRRLLEGIQPTAGGETGGASLRQTSDADAAFRRARFGGGCRVSPRLEGSTNDGSGRREVAVEWRGSTWSGDRVFGKDRSARKGGGSQARRPEPCARPVGAGSLYHEEAAAPWRAAGDSTRGDPPWPR